MNDNLDYFKNIDIAIEHFKNASTVELFNFLKGDDEVLQQIALLKLENISSQTEAELICNTLTGHSSETREYCAFLINRLMKNPDNIPYFTGDFILTKFTDAISDVNPKVCRKIIEILPLYKNLDVLYLNLLTNSFLFVDELREKNKNKNYQYNTKSFHLYWHIFALGYTLKHDLFDLYKDKLIKLLDLIFDFNEYTLREKGAFLLKMLTNYLSEKDANILYSKYSSDENFYVQEILD